MKKFWEKLCHWIDEMNDKHIDQYTSQCAYFIILSFIPFIMLMLTLTKYLGIGQENLFDIFSQLMPSNILGDAVLGIVKEVYSKSIGTITISIIFVLWSAGKGFLALCKGLEVIYEVPENKHAKAEKRADSSKRFWDDYRNVSNLREQNSLKKMG